MSRDRLRLTILNDGCYNHLRIHGASCVLSIQPEEPGLRNGINKPIEFKRNRPEVVIFVGADPLDVLGAHIGCRSISSQCHRVKAAGSKTTLTLQPDLGNCLIVCTPVQEKCRQDNRQRSSCGRRSTPERYHGLRITESCSRCSEPVISSPLLLSHPYPRPQPCLIKEAGTPFFSGLRAPIAQPPAVHYSLNPKQG